LLHDASESLHVKLVNPTLVEVVPGSALDIVKEFDKSNKDSEDKPIIQLVT